MNEFTKKKLEGVEKKICIELEDHIEDCAYGVNIDNIMAIVTTAIQEAQEEQKATLIAGIEEEKENYILNMPVKTGVRHLEYEAGIDKAIKLIKEGAEKKGYL